MNDHNGHLDEPELKEAKPGQEEKHSFDEEFGVEMAPPTPMIANPVPDHPQERHMLNKTGDREEETAGTGGQTVGWLGLALAIASLFIYPALMGLAGIVLGVIAYVQGSRTIGAWAAGIGIVSLVAYFVIIPFYT